MRLKLTPELVVLLVVVAVMSSLITRNFTRSQQTTLPTPPPPPSTNSDPYQGWITGEAGGVVEYKIPSTCTSSGAAGSQYIECSASSKIDQSPADIVISSDGQQVNVRKGDNSTFAYWDLFIASLKVKTPVTHDIQINVKY